jgi:hypothetical protein
MSLRHDTRLPSCLRRTPHAARAAWRWLPLLLLLAGVAPADERRQSDRDTARHPARSEASAPADVGQPSAGPQRARTPAVQGRRPTPLEELDPAVRQYWSDKCVQQRARGWGQTGDCNHPAYSGDSYGTPRVIVVPQPYPVERAPRGRGHLNMPPPRPGGRGHLR